MSFPVYALERFVKSRFVVPHQVVLLDIIVCQGIEQFVSLIFHTEFILLRLQRRHNVSGVFESRIDPYPAVKVFRMAEINGGVFRRVVNQSVQRSRILSHNPVNTGQLHTGLVLPLVAP